MLPGAVPTYELQLESISSGNTELSYSDFLLTGMIALTIGQGGMFEMVGLVSKQCMNGYNLYLLSFPSPILLKAKEKVWFMKRGIFTSILWAGIGIVGLWGVITFIVGSRFYKIDC